MSPYNSVQLGEENLCLNCSNYNSGLNFSFGTNEYSIFASSDKRGMEEKIETTILSGFDFERNFDCPDCSKKKVRRNSSVEVTLELNLSHNVTGLVVEEYVPLSWEILNLGEAKKKYLEETNG